MFFEYWMIGLVVLLYAAFGFFMFRSGVRTGVRIGIKAGIQSTLFNLQARNIIKMTDTRIEAVQHEKVSD